MNRYSFCPVCRQLLEWAEIDGRARKICNSCSWVHYINPIPAVLAYVVNRNEELLVVRRAHEPAFNEWALPGGFLEAGEEASDGCLRELMEETSLAGKIDRLVGVYHRNVEKYGSVLVIAYSVVVEDDTLSLNHELSEGAFYPQELIPEVRIPLHLQIIHDAALFELVS
ncbi:MAG: NUDIX hydrolase [Chlorobiaceae bacterium]|nr:NUDIX hydrolase [Chlorobiaceae bacterium]